MTWHSGGLFAYITFLALVPDIDLGFFVSTSGPGGSNSSRIIRQLFYYVADLGLGEEPWLNLTNACGFPEPWLNATSAAGAEEEEEDPQHNDTVIVDDDAEGGGFEGRDRFTGSYGHLLFGDVEIAANGSRGLRAKYNRLEGRLHRTTAASGGSVAMLEVGGGLAFLSRTGDNATKYVKFNFTRPAGGGPYQELEVSAPDMGEMDPLVFRRGVQFADPVTDSGGRGHGHGHGHCGADIARLLFCTLLSALTFSFLGGSSM